MKTAKALLIFIVALFLFNCGETTGNVGGTETGTTDPGNIDTTTIGTKVNAIAQALVPSITSSQTNPSLSSEPQALTYQSSDNWATYLEGNNVTLLTDVFGPNEGDAPVTRIRVLVDQFRSTVDSIFSSDSDFSCTGKETLSEGDTLEIPFYGTLSNGTSDNRYYDCLSTNTGNNNSSTYKTLYGQDSSGVVRVVDMYDVTTDNIWWPEERGDFIRNLTIVQTAYTEATENEQTVGYLDIQYAQASLYSGLDNVHGTNDDVTFKSRSRITGRAILDTSGNPTAATGDFTVTKYDRNIDNDSVQITVTQSIGRGSYEEGDISLFNIDSSSLEGKEGTYCIQHATTTLPSYVASENCTSLETQVPWTGSTFPFSLSPALEENFESKTFFEGDETDLISNSGDNFTIPDYQSQPVAAE